MGISRDHWHKRRATGGKRAPIRQKRKFELGRPAAMTKLGPQRIHTIRARGGNKKYRALRLDQGNFAWGSEAVTRKTRIIDVVYNAANNELVRTKTLVKNAIIVIDATPFRQWYEAHYALPLGHKKNAKLTEAEEALLNKKRSNKTQKKYKDRQTEAKVRPMYLDYMSHTDTNPSKKFINSTLSMSSLSPRFLEKLVKFAICLHFTL